MRGFEKIKIDPPQADDIPHPDEVPIILGLHRIYYPYLGQNDPKFQITARDVRIGLIYLRFFYEKTTTNVAVFTYLLSCHLSRPVVVQSKSNGLAKR